MLPVSAAGNYTSSFELPQNGSDQISCQATSGAGIVGNPTTETVDLDNPSNSTGSGGVTKYGSSPLIDDGADPFSNGPSQTTWYRTEQQVTITANNTAGSAPIASIQCTGAPSGGGAWPISSQNTDAQGGEKATVTVSAPGGDLACTATDAAGNVYSLGSYEFQIDNTAPVGAFVAQSKWPQPNELELNVGDDGGSGVSVVRVYAQASSGAAIDLGQATYDASGGDYQATVPDGGMPPGNYTFYANVADVAGNTGQITASPTGGAEQLTLPLRQVTSVSLTAANVTGTEDATTPQALSPALGISPSAQIRGRAGRDLLATDARAINSTKHPRSHKTLSERFGKTITIKGVLRNVKKHVVLRHQRLLVYELISGQKKPRRIGTVATNSRGRYSYRARGAANRVIYVAYPGTSRLRPSVAQTRETFTGKLTFHAGQVKAGGTMTLSGNVKGGYIPADGVEVTVRFREVGAPGAGVLGTTRTNKHGVFRFKQKFSRRVGGAHYQLWATVSPQHAWPYKGATSGKMLRVVSR